MTHGDEMLRVRRPKNFRRRRRWIALIVLHLDGTVGLLVARVGIGGAAVGGELRFIRRTEFAEKQIGIAHERSPFAVGRIAWAYGGVAEEIAVARAAPPLALGPPPVNDG